MSSANEPTSASKISGDRSDGAMTAAQRIRSGLRAGHAVRRQKADAAVRASDDQSMADHGLFGQEQADGTSGQKSHGTGGMSAGQQGHAHPLIPTGQLQLITKQSDLLEFLDHCRSVGSFAYDSEFIGELNYRPLLCLVQLATHSRIAVVDPLSEELPSMAPLWELIADPEVEKVVHAGEQDLEPVVRHLNKPAANVFDTQVAGGFCGLGYPLSLAKLVLSHIGARLSKAHTFTNWQHRPLTSAQLRYAADDVRYLPAIRSMIAMDVEAMGHAAALKEELDELCQIQRYKFDLETQISRVRGSGSLTPREMPVLKSLVLWRENVAKQADLPPRVMLRDEVLIELSRKAPSDASKLSNTKGIPRPIVDEHAGEIIQAVKAGVELSHSVPKTVTQQQEPEPQAKFQADTLLSALQLLCQGQGIDPQLTAARADLNELIEHLSSGGSQTTPALLTGWRGRLIGEPLSQLWKGCASLSLAWNQSRATTRMANRQGDQ